MLHVTHARALYGDTDQAGVVYHANYLRWFELGRTELMRDAGHPYGAFEVDRALRLTVVEAHLDYHAPARYDETVAIETWLEDFRRVQFTVRNRILDAGSGRQLVTGYVRLACVTFAGKLQAVPDDVRAALLRYVPSTASGKDFPASVVKGRQS